MAVTHLPAHELIAAIDKEFGKNTLVRATEAVGLIKPRLSTGSLSLDLVLGGGFPEGAVTLLEGQAAASKSWTLNTMAKNYLAKYPEGIYVLVNAEGTNDPAFLSMLGVDLERTYFIQPDSGEQGWDAACRVASLAQRAFIGVDSLDALTPMKEIEGDAADALYAPAAKMNNKGFRKLIMAMKSDLTRADPRITAVFITQLREKIGVMFGDPLASVGGMGKKFAAMTIIRLTGSKVLKVNVDEDASEKDKNAPKAAYGLEIRAQVIKNKGWGAGEEVRYNLYKENYAGFRRGEIDNVTELIPFLLLYKVIEKVGTSLVFNGERYSLATLTKHMQDNPAILASCLATVTGLHAVRYNPTEGAVPRGETPKVVVPPPSRPLPPTRVATPAAKAPTKATPAKVPLKAKTAIPPKARK